MRPYSLAELQELPTINSGHFDDLKIETNTRRVWLSRMTVADGAPYNNQVTIEQLQGGRWFTTLTYEAC